jgi:hypothetical protein
MKITAELLCAKGACTDQIALFRKFYPDGTTVTVERCLEHVADFYWGWGARNLLSEPAWRAYNEEIAPALKACEDAWEAYNKTGRAYDGESVLARKNYDEVWKVYNEICAVAFARAALGEPRTHITATTTERYTR